MNARGGTIRAGRGPVRALQAMAFAALIAVGGMVPAAAVQNNWHVHDGQAGDGHKPTAFFPFILTGGDLATYLLDPAQCPNATDKTLLPNGLEENQPYRAGVCMTSTTVIHLRTIPETDPAPSGWSMVPPTVPGGTTVLNGVTYRTYYQVTAR